MGGAFVVSRSNRPASRRRQRERRALSRLTLHGGRRLCRLHRAHGNSARSSSAAAGGDEEELFQLEIDRQQGKVSPEEYTTAKSALDETIRRALARNKT